jgi:hypothetical protein
MLKGTRKVQWVFRARGCCYLGFPNRPNPANPLGSSVVSEILPAFAPVEVVVVGRGCRRISWGAEGGGATPVWRFLSGSCSLAGGPGGGYAGPPLVTAGLTIRPTWANIIVLLGALGLELAPVGAWALRERRRGREFLIAHRVCGARAGRCCYFRRWSALSPRWELRRPRACVARDVCGGRGVPAVAAPDVP